MEHICDLTAVARPCPKVCANLQTKIEAMIAWLEHNKSDNHDINCDALKHIITYLCKLFFKLISTTDKTEEG